MRKYRVLSNGRFLRLMYKDFLFWNYFYVEDDRGLERYKNCATLEEAEAFIAQDKAQRDQDRWVVVRRL